MGEGIVVRWANGSSFLQLVAIIHFIISMMKKFVRSLPNFYTSTYVLISIMLKTHTHTQKPFSLKIWQNNQKIQITKEEVLKTPIIASPERETVPLLTPVGLSWAYFLLYFVQRLPLRHHFSLDVIILHALFIFKYIFKTKHDFVDIFPC